MEPRYLTANMVQTGKSHLKQGILKTRYVGYHHMYNVLIWVDRPTRLRDTWFGFLACVTLLLLKVCL